MLNCDLHLHSFRSPDCGMSLDSIVRRCLQVGLNCIALTDHNTLSAVRDLQSVAPFPVIGGEEIMTTEGEIIGLFLNEEIPWGKTPGVTVEEIRRQGGVVYVPHPFDRVRRSVLSRGALMEILDQVDVIEVYNSRISLGADLEAAERFAAEHGKLRGGGSDAHTVLELGNTRIEMPEFVGRERFLESLAEGTIIGHRASPFVHLASSLTKLRKKRAKLFGSKSP